MKIKELELIADTDKKPLFRCVLNSNNDTIKLEQQVINAWDIVKINNFLRDLDSGINVEFKNYVQYKKLINKIKDAINDNIYNYKNNKKIIKIGG